MHIFLLVHKILYCQNYLISYLIISRNFIDFLKVPNRENRYNIRNVY